MSDTDTHAAPATIGVAPAFHANRIGVSVDFSTADQRALSTAIDLARSGATLVIMHCIETPTARIFGGSANDAETVTDQMRLDSYVAQITAQNVSCEGHLRAGVPHNAIVKAVNDLNIDLLIMASHGHKAFGDLIRGATIDKVRHNVKIPVLIIPPIK